MDSETGRGREQSFRAAARQSVRLVDCVLLLSVPAVVVGVFLLPEAVRRSLTFAYLDPTLLTAYTAPFVHLRVGHLLANMLGYLLLAGVGYLLAALANRRRLFGVAAATYVLAFPPVLSALNLAVPRHAVGYGFSGVTVAFAGVLPLLLVSYARQSLNVRLELRHAPGFFFATLAVVVLAALPYSFVTLGIAAAAGLAALRYAVAYVDARPAGRTTHVSLESHAGWVDLFVVGVCLLLGYPFVGFPNGLQGGESVPNLYVHLLGFCLAFIIPYVALELGLFRHGRRDAA